MQAAHYFAALARYHLWATERLLDHHLAALSDELWYRDSGLFFRSVHGTVNHLLVTDTVWHARFSEGLSMQMALDTEMHSEREPLVKALRAAVHRWSPWLVGLDAQRFEGGLQYTRNNGEQVHIPFAPALGHVFNHATHHRGQLSAVLTSLTQVGPELDWVYLLQQEANAG